MSTKAVEQLTVTVPQAARMLGIGRTKAFQMARDGELPGVIRIGRVYRVSRARLLEWIDGGCRASANGHGRPPATTPDEV